MRIVLFRTDKIGDLLVSSPVIAAIKARHPYAQIMLVASPYNAVALEGHKDIDACVLLSGTMPAQERKAAQERIRAFAPSHALVLSPKHHCYMASLLSGAREIGWIIMEYRPLARLAAALLPLRARELIPTSQRTLHHSDHVLRLARHMGLADEGFYPYQIGHDDMAQAKVRALLTEHKFDRYIAVHLVDKWLEEEWKAEDVRHFLKELRAQSGLPLIMTAGPADTILSTALKDDFPLFTGLGLHEWAGLLGGAQLVITPDCGAVHIACALHKPLLALYQPARFTRAVTEYGPKGTLHVAKALSPPSAQIPELLSDTLSLLTRQP